MLSTNSMWLQSYIPLVGGSRRIGRRSTRPAYYVSFLLSEGRCGSLIKELASPQSHSSVPQYDSRSFLSYQVDRGHMLRCRFTPPDLPSFADLCRQADDNLFNNILNNSHHVLHHLPPPSQASQHYTLRSRRHNLQLSITSTSLIDKNFLPRMLHMDSY